MPKTGDFFVTTLKDIHLNWGTKRYTATRKKIKGEGYLQIPKREARRLEITNSSNPGVNYIYTCSSSDGYLKDVPLKASGSTKGGDILAKQFQGSGNLKKLGGWFTYVNAQVGDRVEIKWISSTEIVIRKL